MTSLAFHRMRDEIAVAMIAAAFLASTLAYIPNYQSIAYQNTPAKEYDKYNDNSGYPAAEGFPTVSSVEDIEACKDKNFTIIIDVAKLKPVDMYMNIAEETGFTNGILRVINNNEDGGIGRFFVAELESGEQVVIFLDDTTINLPKEGVVTLPIGKHEKLAESEFLSILREKSGMQEVNSYIDMAGDWREGEEAEKSDILRGFILVIVFVASWILLACLFIKICEK